MSAPLDPGLDPKEVRDALDKIEERQQSTEATIQALRQDLISQDHRLVSAVLGAIRVALTRPFDMITFRSYVSAIAWCLLSTTAVTATGLVAFIGLIVAWQANRLTQVQNQEIRIQSNLSEAQRRSALMFEMTSIFETIEKEKEETRKALEKNGKEVDGSNFKPTRATLGRIAALSQSLRPYRYLDDDFETRIPCTAWDAMDRTLETIASFNEDSDGAGVEISPEAFLGRYHSSETSAHAIVERLRTIGQWFLPDRVADRLTCFSSSPERGQLLVALHASGVDLSAAIEAGATFERADAQGADLSGMKVRGLDLFGARLLGANLLNTEFQDSSLQEADVADASMDETTKWGPSGMDQDASTNLTHAVFPCPMDSNEFPNGDPPPSPLGAFGEWTLYTVNGLRFACDHMQERKARIQEAIRAGLGDSEAEEVEEEGHDAAAGTYYLVIYRNVQLLGATELAEVRAGENPFAPDARYEGAGKWDVKLPFLVELDEEQGESIEILDLLASES